MRSLQITVVGGGIGGLAAAVALRRDGHRVTVLERAPEFAPLGAGLSIWPNAVHALRELGLGDVADAAEVPRGDGGIRRARDGSLIAETNSAQLERRYGAPLVLVHRADLQGALLEAAGAEAVRFGAAAASVEGDGAVTLDSGERVEADVVVGADGIGSVVRERLIGDGEPRASGYVAYRSVVPWDAEVPAGEYWGRGEVFGVVPLSRGRVYWYAAVSTGEDVDGDGAARLAALRARHRSWAQSIPDLLATTTPERLLRHELFDRDPAERWGRGAVTLLGDAAHPMLPFLGQGACSALEDAVALARALREEGADPQRALRAYEAERAPRTAALVMGSRTAARVAMLRSPLGARVRDVVVRLVPESARLRQLDRAIGRRS